MKKTIRSWRRWYPFAQIGRDVVKGLLGHRARLRRGIGGLGSGGRLRGAWRLYSSHCDIFWSQLVPQIMPDFRLAPAAAALRFSWEVLPSRCFEICGGRLPFGIHAWAKYDLPFLRPLLEASGVELDLSEVPGHGADHEIGGGSLPTAVSKTPRPRRRADTTPFWRRHWALGSPAPAHLVIFMSSQTRCCHLHSGR